MSIFFQGCNKEKWPEARKVLIKVYIVTASQINLGPVSQAPETVRCEGEAFLLCGLM